MPFLSPVNKFDKFNKRQWPRRSICSGEVIDDGFNHILNIFWFDCDFEAFVVWSDVGIFFGSAKCFLSSITCGVWGQTSIFLLDSNWNKSSSWYKSLRLKLCARIGSPRMQCHASKMLSNVPNWSVSNKDKRDISMSLMSTGSRSSRLGNLICLNWAGADSVFDFKIFLNVRMLECS